MTPPCDIPEAQLLSEPCPVCGHHMNYHAHLPDGRGLCTVCMEPEKPVRSVRDWMDRAQR